jgi:hypothetical protein
MYVPSGDQRGAPSFAPSVRRAAGADPSVGATRISER